MAGSCVLSCLLDHLTVLYHLLTYFIYPVSLLLFHILSSTELLHHRLGITLVENWLLFQTIPLGFNISNLPLGLKVL